MHLSNGMLVLMGSKSEDSLASVSGDESSQSESGRTWSSSDRKCKRREKNRVAAQRSRKKQTEKADTLHQELQALEHSNALYEREIKGLRLEIHRYTSALQQHEPHCSLHTSTSAAGPHHAPCPTPAPTPNPAAPPPTEPSLAELLDSTDWSQFWELF